MSETVIHEHASVETNIRELRLLTEVEHLRNAMLPDGSIPEVVLQDVGTNLRTAVYEIAMPLAVSVTAHRVEYLEAEEGEKQRVITWLGRNAIENALGGKRFHRSLAAHKRVDIEVAEAQKAQEDLRPGVAQVFISPKMSRHDATAEVAKAEHLHDDDSLRVSYAVTNSRGEVVSRRLESLLVRDVPLEAWVNMLSDPNNIFGKSLDIDNKDSALSVMALFDQLELPEEAIPEGPVSLVEAVLPYVSDLDAQNSVAKQLEGFRGDQAKYKEQAEKTAQDWLEFEIELAKSLNNRAATYDITRFIVGLQHNWSEDNLKIINSHHFDDQGFRMTKQLAGVLEDAKRQVLNGLAGLLTGNEKMTKQIVANDLKDIQATQQYLDVLRYANIPYEEINKLQMEVERKVAKQNIGVSGGCPGSSTNNFVGTEGNDSGQSESPESGPDKRDWKWKSGKCQVKTCLSPNPTKVGPCSVCERCQAKFDAGEDPTKPSIAAAVISSLGKSARKQLSK